MAVSLSQASFRFGSNDGTESTHGWLGDQNADISLQTATTFLLRILVQETGGTAIANVNFEFQCSKNGAGWNNVTTTSAVCRAVASTPLVDGGDSSNRLGGTGAFDATNDCQTEVGQSGGPANDCAASGKMETVCSMQIVDADVADDDLIDFRLTRDVGILLEVYAVTATLTVIKAAAYTDSGTMVGTGIATGSDVAGRVDAGTMAGSGVSSGSDVFGAVDASTMIGIASASGSDSFGHTDAGTMIGAALVSGTDVAAFLDAGTVAATAIAAGSDQFAATDAGSAVGVGIGLGIDQFGTADAGTGVGQGVCSGEDEYTPAGGDNWTDEGTMAALGVVFGSDQFGGIDAGLAAAIGACLGTDIGAFTDSAVVTAAAVCSGSDQYHQAGVTRRAHGRFVLGA